MKSHNINVFFALLHRDILLLKRKLWSKLIDGLFMCFIIVTTTGYLLPALGMPADMIGPMFVNIFFNIFFMFGFSLAVNMINEIKYKGRLYYLLTLPVNKFWVFASYITTFMIEATIIIAPLLILGLFILQNKIVFVQPHPILFILIYLASLLFFGIFMLFFSVHYTYNWFLDNVWSRRLSPMFSFGSTFFIWQQAFAITPLLAYAMLCNPLTYICEGLRFGFIGGNKFINGWLCLIAIVSFTMTTMFFLNTSIKKRLDPV
ncbi:MAG: hypothetical protein WD055_02145 [Candidatus Dependentiae bacterium]